eukprot:15069933-Alexandrium_andersonii.AAC.1
MKRIEKAAPRNNSSLRSMQRYIFFLDSRWKKRRVVGRHLPVISEARHVKAFSLKARRAWQA